MTVSDETVISRCNRGMAERRRKPVAPKSACAGSMSRSDASNWGGGLLGKQGEDNMAACT